MVLKLVIELVYYIHSHFTINTSINIYCIVLYVINHLNILHLTLYCGCSMNYGIQLYTLKCTNSPCNYFFPGALSKMFSLQTSHH